MDSSDTLRAIRHEMEEQGIDLLLGFHDGAHFIEKPNAVMVLSGFKSLGHALVILPRATRARSLSRRPGMRREPQNVARLCGPLEPIA